MRNIILACVLACNFTDSTCAVETLAQVAKYSKAHSEFIDSDYKGGPNEVYYPYFENYFVAQKPSFWTRLLQWFGYGKTNDLFDTAHVKQLIYEVIQRRELEAFYGKHVVTLPLGAGEHLVVFGDLQGAFHSFVRDLLELEKLGIVSDDFKIKQGYYFVFNANVIGRTPYNLELLAIILTLMQKNPAQVIYIRGAYEDENYGGQSFTRQLFNLGELNAKDKNSLGSLFERFLNTLPYAAYVNYKEGKELFRISGYGRDREAINERMMGNYFKRPATETFVYRLENKLPASHDIHVRAMIKSVDGTEDIIAPEAIKLLDPYGGATTWTSFSSPTQLHNKISNFYNDSFIIIDLGENLSDAIINVYSRDIRTDDPFVQTKRFMLQRGDELLPGMKPQDVRNTINIGSTLDLTKIVAITGRAVRQGILSCVQEHNKQQGQEPKLKVFILDDGYSPAKAHENIDYLMQEEKIDIFLLPVGSPTLYASLDLLKAGSIVTLFPVTGAQEFRVPDLPGIINLRASYREEVYALVPYLIKRHAAKRFVFFYQDDVYGMTPMQVAREILLEQGITEWTEIPYNRNTTDFKEVVERIIKAQPDALGLFSSAAPTAEMLRQLGIRPLVGIQVFGTSFLADDAFKRFSEDLGYKYVFARAVPNPQESDWPIADEYRTIMQQQGHKISPFSFEAYIGTSLLYHALPSLRGVVNHETVRTYFENLKDFSYKGLKLNFDPLTRGLMQDVWLDTGKTTWIKVSSPEATYREEMRIKSRLQPDAPDFEEEEG